MSGVYLDQRAAISGDALAALDADVSPAAAVACYLTAALGVAEQRALLAYGTGARRTRRARGPHGLGH